MSASLALMISATEAGLTMIVSGRVDNDWISLLLGLCCSN